MLRLFPSRMRHFIYSLAALKIPTHGPFWPKTRSFLKDIGTEMSMIWLSTVAGKLMQRTRTDSLIMFLVALGVNVTFCTFFLAVAVKGTSSSSLTVCMTPVMAFWSTSFHWMSCWAVLGEIFWSLQRGRSGGMQFAGAWLPAWLEGRHARRGRRRESALWLPMDELLESYERLSTLGGRKPCAFVSSCSWVWVIRLWVSNLKQLLTCIA